MNYNKKLNNNKIKSDMLSVMIKVKDENVICLSNNKLRIGIKKYFFIIILELFCLFFIANFALCCLITRLTPILCF